MALRVFTSRGEKSIPPKIMKPVLEPYFRKYLKTKSRKKKEDEESLWVMEDTRKFGMNLWPTNLSVWNVVAVENDWFEC